MKALILLQVTTHIIQKESYFQILLKAGWILIPLAFLSLVAVYVIIEKSGQYGKAYRRHNLLPQLYDYLRDGKVDSAIATCEANSLPVARVIGAGLKNLGSPIKDIEGAMESESRQQLDKLEGGLNYLGITASIAPMFGFLGTIFGVIKIFYNISLTDNISIGVISGGLYQKMISSASGLLVGIIAYTGYHLLNSKLNKISIRMERDCNDFLSMIKKPEKV
jgi:biopolymer transport protein ExbB